MKNKKLKLGSHVISSNSLPYIIAEIGVNHNCSIKIAKKMIRQAKTGGAHAVKFQTYKAEKIASKKSPSYWDTKEEKSTNQYNLFKKYDKLEISDYKILKKYCDQINIDFLSTPFDNDVVIPLNSLVPLFKVASSDITNFPLLEKIAKTKKTVLLSTGASTLKEIKLAYNFLRKKGTKNIVILHCILSYPTLDRNANLNMISDIQKNFPDTFIGYSDHTKPSKNMDSIIASYILGARVIEKHFTYNKKLKGNDHYHAMDINDLKIMVDQLNKTRKLLGNVNHKKPIKEEFLSRKNARRSIYTNKKIKINQIIKESDIICKRPGVGMSPNNFYKIVGKRSKRNLESDVLIKKNYFK